MGQIPRLYYSYNVLFNSSSNPTVIMCKSLNEVKMFLRRYAQQGVFFQVGKNYLYDTNGQFISRGNWVAEGKQEILGYEFKQYVLTLSNNMNCSCYFNTKLQLKMFLAGITTVALTDYTIIENNFKVVEASALNSVKLEKTTKSLTFEDL